MKEGGMTEQSLLLRGEDETIRPEATEVDWVPVVKFGRIPSMIMRPTDASLMQTFNAADG